MAKVVGDLYHDNCFHVQNDTPTYERPITMVILKNTMTIFNIKFEADKEFLISYYRDEIKAKGH